MPRALWDGLEPALRADIERLAGARVVEAHSCPGGFSPGFASRLAVAGGGQVFVKAIDARRWPHEVAAYRDEIRVNAVLPATAPAPAFLGAVDDTRWVVLAFEDVDGAPPTTPWTDHDLDRVLVTRLGPGGGLPRDFPRLGGWATLDAGLDPWAAANRATLVDLERRGLLVAARGNALVHCDLYPHNILLTPDRVVVVDWPHARIGSPIIDLVTVLTSAAADGLDPDAALRRHAGHVPPADLDAVLAAHAGFLMSGGPPGLERIAAEKRRLGAAAVGWLRARVAGRHGPIEE